MIRLEHSPFYILAGDKPGLVEIGRMDTEERILCNPAGLSSVWTVYDPVLGEKLEISDTDPGFSCTTSKYESGLCYHVKLKQARQILQAKVYLTLDHDCLRLELREVEESEEMHLLTVRLNGLSAARERDTASRLAMPSHGGRLINPALCADGQKDHRYNWILDSFGSAAVVFTNGLSAVPRIHWMDDELTTQVGGKNGDRWAQVGAFLRYRYCQLDDSYRKAKPKRDPANTEDQESLPIEKDFLTGNTPQVSVGLLAHGTVQPENGWVPGATWIRDQLPGKRTNDYQGKMVYKIFVGAPHQKVATNLEQVRKLIFDFAARTGNAGQIPYLVGYQHGGHDDQYPDTFTLNPALDSKEALEKLVKDAEQVNCRLSFHDNFDDAYACSLCWNAEDISRDNTGHLLRGGVWNGVQAYWNSMPFYAAYRAEERIKRLQKTYPFLKDTYHLDVLTASVFRVDFRGGNPTGREADKKARLQIVELFRQNGLDVTSEACGLPFVGEISYFWHMQRVARPLYEGDSRIPMIPFLVHGKADYAGTHTDCLHSIQDGLLYGGFYCNDVTSSTPIKELTDAYFMLQAPLDRIRDDLAVDYQENNGWKTIRYQSGAEIAVEFETGEIRVTIDGKRLIENGSAMIPQEDGTTLLYRCCEEPYIDVLWNTELPKGTVLTLTPLGVDLPVRQVIVGEDHCIPIDTDLGVAYVARV